MKDRLAEVVDEVVITGQNTGEKMCSCESDVVDETCSSESYDACGDGLFTFEKSLSLSHFRGILGRNKTVVLAKKYVNGHTCRTGYKLFNTP